MMAAERLPAPTSGGCARSNVPVRVARMGRRATVAILAVAAGVALPNTAQAAQYTVAAFGDGVAACNAVSAQCPTLRSAVAAADGTPETDVIFLPAGDYVLSNGALALNSQMSIVGGGARTTAIHALGSNQALTVANGATVVLLK